MGRAGCERARPFRGGRPLAGGAVASLAGLCFTAGVSKRLLLVYHSQSGASFRLAAAARAGALLESGVELLWRRAWDAGMADLRAADGILLAAPENSASITGAMKDFLDRTFYPAQDNPPHCPYGLIISAGNDGSGAARQLERILRGYPMKPAAPPLICRGDPAPEHLSAAQDLGQALAAGLAMGIY